MKVFVEIYFILTYSNSHTFFYQTGDRGRGCQTWPVHSECCGRFWHWRPLQSSRPCKKVPKFNHEKGHQTTKRCAKQEAGGLDRNRLIFSFYFKIIRMTCIMCYSRKFPYPHHRGSLENHKKLLFWPLVSCLMLNGIRT